MNPRHLERLFVFLLEALRRGREPLEDATIALLDRRGGGRWGRRRASSRRWLRRRRGGRSLTRHLARTHADESLNTGWVTHATRRARLVRNRRRVVDPRRT